MIYPRRILICGLGRSGTSWVHKVFDHHSRVLALYEPESTLLEEANKVFERNGTHEIRSFTDRMFSDRSLRAIRKRPILFKPYRTAWQHAVRLALIYGASQLDKAFGVRAAQGLQIPDFSLPADCVTVVAKLVSLQLWLGDFARANPDLPCIYVIRHPCGYASSVMRGVRKGMMPPDYLPPRDRMDQMYDLAKPACQMTEADVDDSERLAYRWAVINDIAIEAARKHPNIRIVSYEDLCADPIAAFRDLLDWTGLGWDPACETFLQASIGSGIRDGDYHSVARDPKLSARKWHRDLPRSEQQKILHIARRSRAAKMLRL